MTDLASPAVPATPAVPTALTAARHRVWPILLVVLLADALDLIDATITNVAAPSIVRDLGGGSALVKWLGASYALALGSLLVLGGRLGDRLGQRRMLLVGMAGFVVASAVAGLALDPAMLVVARAGQGAFGALLIPQGMAIMTKTFPRDTLAKAFGAFGPMLGIFAVGGPILAGFLIDANLFGLGWRSMFLINIVLGGAGLILAARVLPHLEPDPSARIDLLGALLLVIAMFGVLYGLITGSSDGWHTIPIASLSVGLCLFGAFAVRQATTAEPLIKPTLFRSRGFVSGLVVGLLVFAAFNGLMYVISLFFQLGLGYSPSRTSLALLPLTIGIIIAAGSCMALITRLGRTLVLAGLLLTAAGAALMLWVVASAGLNATWWQLALATLVIGLGAGTCFSSIFDTALGDIDHDEAGAASGSISAVQQLAAGIGSATVTSIYFAAVATGQTHAVIRGVAVVLGLCVVCLAAVPLLPRKAAALEH
ncbi:MULTISPECIES: MFS transporter [unclassified Frankia]|uniref:MFS transporter n=1 Tax=unclassified Frankia TaxID=2632575 RepID=UPI001EE41C5D|nr:MULTISPECIES: MFS transporter [unclassified Frankia]